ncbi:hypothetical protein ACFVFI_37900, partial [Streptomyces sp. NPDC057705]
MPPRTPQTPETAAPTDRAGPTETRRPARSASTVTGLFAACHPLPATAVTLFSAALAAAAGRSLPGAAVTVGAVAAGQLSVGWCNDRADLRRDLATGRRDKPLVAGTVSSAAVARAAVVSLLIFVPLSLSAGLLAGAPHLVA